MARKASSSAKTRDSGFPTSPRRFKTTWLRTPVLIPSSGRLNVLIYSRYSTDEQHERSIDGQNGYSRRFVEDLDIEPVNFQFLSDEGISGEQIGRPGINEVRVGIAQRTWHLILVEDSSRFYRDPLPCIDLVRSAVDQGIRVLCLNDYIDTTDERWEEQLYEAQRHHAQANKFTIARIKRDQEERWESKAAMGPLRSGYNRIAAQPATMRRPAEGPFRDEIDPQWQAVIYEAFEQIAADHPVWSVGPWLDQEGLPKTNGETDSTWTDKRVIALIQCKLYRGAEDYRKTVSRKQHGSGKRKPAWAKPDERWERDMPELRIVPDWLWYRANEAILRRTRGTGRPRGIEHLLSGIPRDSRGPLSHIFVCRICGEKMYQDGRNEGGYRCKNSKKGCWNKATALRDDVHRYLSAEICGWLLELDSEFPTILETLREQLGADAERRSQRLATLRKEQLAQEAKCESLLDVIESLKGSHEAPERLGQRLLQREKELKQTVAEIERLEELATSLRIPTTDELKANRDEIVSQLRIMNRETSAVLRRLTPKIFAVPYQQYGTNKVVLRAAFDIDLKALLPTELWHELDADRTDSLAALFSKLSMLVDLFDPSIAPRFGLKALAYQNSGMSLAQVGRVLGFSKHRASVAIEYGRKLRDAGLSDPFIELTEAPTAASRWRVHKRFQSQDSNNSPGENPG